MSYDFMVGNVNDRYKIIFVRNNSLITILFLVAYEYLQSIQLIFAHGIICGWPGKYR